MSITLTQSSEQKYSGDFSGKIEFTDYEDLEYCTVHFVSYEEIVAEDIYKIIVEESIPYNFEVYIYPDTAVDIIFGLSVKWYFDDGSNEISSHWDDSLSEGEWSLLQHEFTAPYYADKNVQYATIFLLILPPNTGEDITIYVDDVKFYPVIIDQTTLTEDGIYWISILKGFQFIDRTEGYRSVGYPGTSAPLYGFDIRRAGSKKLTIVLS